MWRGSARLWLAGESGRGVVSEGDGEISPSFSSSSRDFLCSYSPASSSHRQRLHLLNISLALRSGTSSSLSQLPSLETLERRIGLKFSHQSLV